MAGTESDMAETIWALEEACEASLCAGDYEKSISFYHDDFLGWPEVASPVMDKSDLLSLIKREVPEANAYSFEMERSGIRVIGNTATTNLIYHCAGKTVDGVEFDETYRWAHTWINDDSKWQILTGTSYRID